jgi:zinc protease
VPANATLIAVGDLGMDELRRVASAAFGTWQGGPAPRNEVAAASQLTGRKLVLVDKPGATQSVVAIGHVGLARRDQDEYAVRVMNQVLGGQFMSRINLNLREDKGYTYGARSFFDMRRGQGPFVAAASVQTEVTAPAVQEFLKELRDINGQRPLTEKELVDGRNSITLGFPRQFETAGDLAGKLSDLVLYDLPANYFDSYVRNIEAVDLATANRAGKQRVLPDKAAIVVVGDLSKIEASLLELKLGPVEYRDLDGNPIQPEQVSQLGR